MRRKCKKQPPSLLPWLALFIFLLLFASLFLTFGIFVLLGRAGLLTWERGPASGLPMPLLYFCFASVVIGSVLSLLITYLPVRFVNKIIGGMYRLADGDFSVRIQTNLPGPGQNLTRAFNTLAEELGNTELLRSDFVNNFSHEMKTPIVSIRGFARLLRKQPLTEVQAQYAQVIAEEAQRLSVMTEKILSLTKVENQTILTGAAPFDLSEQLRKSILLLMERIEAKGLELEADFPEVTVSGNAELLEQVWVNVLDNAVKFSPEGGTVAVSVRPGAEAVTVSVLNQAEPLPAEAQRRIFQKFYQADASHSGEGAGIGLSLVKKIVELHRGTVQVAWEEGIFSLRVTLPNDGKGGDS
ncbi:MAG: HAMP domain-containing histidine kinase [Clostridiales bacterium]|nr:HAMP domain-containing histidine kinase [Clostridiales bacterium]